MDKKGLNASLVQQSLEFNVRLKEPTESYLTALFWTMVGTTPNMP